MTTPVIQIEGVSFHYGTQKILDNIHLSVEAGEFLGLIGPNGGGKTTLMRLLVGLEVPETGTVRILGEQPDRSHRWRSQVGVVPQMSKTPSRFPVRARDVVEMGTRLRGSEPLSASERKQRVTESLELVGASAFANKPMWELSGGERQRVLVARALVNRPRLLLLDEPTVGVDSHGQDLIYKWIDEWRKERELTVIFISHDVGVVAQMCNKLACLNIDLHFHDRPDRLTGDALEKAYGCPAEVVFHSTHLPHRVVGEHKH